MATDEFTNSSVPFARDFDAGCPGGKAHFIVYFRQSDEANGRPDSDWIMERTSDKAVMTCGPLEDMLLLCGTPEFPHARRATKSEDMLRFQFRIFGMQMGPPLHIRRDYTNTPRRQIVDNTPEEIRSVLKTFLVEPLAEPAFPSYDKEPS
jgi:hypothetical protein